MVNLLTSDRPLRSSVDSRSSHRLFVAPPETFEQTSRKLSVVFGNSKGKRKAIRKTMEYERLSERLQTTIGIQIDTNLNSESFLVSFAN
jgi:hypothetical protein